MKRIRVCHLTTVHNRYDTRIFVKECCTLSSKGYEVYLIVADGKGDEEIKGVKILDLGSPSSRFDRILNYRKKILIKALQIGADIYHFHDPELLGVGKSIRQKGLKVVYDAHEDVPRQLLTKDYIPNAIKKLVSRIFEKFENRVVRNLSGVAAATPLIRDRFLLSNKQVVEVQNFPFLREFEAKDNSDLSKKTEAVCYVGSISKVRGIFNIIKSFQYLKGVKLLLGGTFETESLRETCMNLPGWPEVVELGFLDRSQVLNTMESSIAGLVVLEPTINYLDSIPVKMFEYMAAGIPVIASDFPYWRKLLSETDCALFVDPDSPREIATAIQVLIDNKSRAISMGKTGRQAIEEKFNWSKEEQKLLSLYELIIEGSPAAD
jgi:glycosyltransferase involved in cell wall biosynthesis